MLKKGIFHELDIRILVDIEGDPCGVEFMIMSIIKDKIPKKHCNYGKWDYELIGISNDRIYSRD